MADSLIFYHHKTLTENKSEVKGRRENFIVNSISIQILPPSGHDILDTSKHQNKLTDRFFNAIHVDSKKFAVKQFLLFHESDTIQKQNITESERLLRRNMKIRDARIIATPVKGNPGRCDVAVIIQDLGSISVGASKLNDLNTYTIQDRNFLGYSSTVQGSVNYLKRDYQSYALYYEDPNIYNTYADIVLAYSNADSNFVNGARLNKNFSSGLFNWAGGGGFLHKNANRYFYDQSKVLGYYNSGASQTDVWAGKSFRLNFVEDRTDNSIKNFVIAARYININEDTRNIVIPDTIPFTLVNRSSSKILLCYGLSYRRYYKDSYIFRFKYSEDIPEGFVFSILSGKSFNKYYADSYYLGFNTGMANNNRFGYFNVTFQYIRSLSAFSTYNNTVNSLKVFYLSPLLLKKRFKDRVVLTSNFRAIGNDIAFDRLYIGNDDGFLNVNSRLLSGLSKTSFIINNIMYTPYKPFGFYVGYFAYAAFANLSSIRDITLGSTWYKAFGVGLLLRNENILVNSIRISFSYYPGFPATTYKFNPLWIYDLQVPEMSINQPEYELQ